MCQEGVKKKQLGYFGVGQVALAVLVGACLSPPPRTSRRARVIKWPANTCFNQVHLSPRRGSLISGRDESFESAA